MEADFIFWVEFPLLKIFSRTTKRCNLLLKAGSHTPATLILLDLNVLLECLRSFIFLFGTVLNWLKSYLSNIYLHYISKGNLCPSPRAFFFNIVLCRVPLWLCSYSAIRSCLWAVLVIGIVLDFISMLTRHRYCQPNQQFQMMLLPCWRAGKHKSLYKHQFSQLKSEKNPELFVAGSCHQPTPTWTSNPALKFNVGSLAKNLVCFMIASSSFSVAVKRLRLLIISWNKCALLIVHSCFYVPWARLF